MSEERDQLVKQADEAIELLKAEIIKFDAAQQPHFERLKLYAAEARERDEPERHHRLSREASIYLAEWRRARQPMIEQIYRIALARDALTPPKTSFLWTQEVFEGVRQL